MVATALTACGIETKHSGRAPVAGRYLVATALTACGIETIEDNYYVQVLTLRCNSTYLAVCDEGCQ